MNIMEKLQLQRDTGGLVLFKEGVFLRGYNEAAYILTQILEQPLKLTCYQVKQYDNQWIVMCGFPEHKLRDRLPNAVKTAFGARLMGSFDMNRYQNWFRAQCRHADNVGKAAPPREKSAQANFRRGVDAQTANPIPPQLTPMQLDYLQNWYQGKYTIDVDLAFIKSLQQQITAKLHERNYTETYIYPETSLQDLQTTSLS